jgi:hypothetical protein
MLPKRTATVVLFQNAQLLQLKDLYTLQLAVIIYKHINNPSTLPKPINAIFTLAVTIHRHSTRATSNNDLFCHPWSNIIRSQSLKIQGPNIWNKLPFSIKTQTSLPLFKTKLKNLLLQQMIM